MDDVIFEDGYRGQNIRRLRLDPRTGTTSADEFRLTLYAFDVLPAA